MVALETNRDHSVIFEIVSKYCILDSFVNHDGYSISSHQIATVLVNYHIVSEGQKSRYPLGGSSAQGLPKLKSIVGYAVFLSRGSTIERVTS